MRPNHYAVVVGIDRYPARRPDKPLLQYARNDAIAFYEWLTSPNEGGVDPHNANLILATDAEQSGGAGRPVRKEVIDSLISIHERVFERGRSEWPESRLYIYLAGHGVAPQRGRGALLFADFKSQGEGRDMYVWNWGTCSTSTLAGIFTSAARSSMNLSCSVTSAGTSAMRYQRSKRWGSGATARPEALE